MSVYQVASICARPRVLGFGPGGSQQQAAASCRKGVEITQEPVDSQASVSATSTPRLSSQGHLGAPDSRALGTGPGSFTQPTQACGRICVPPAFRSGKNATPWAQHWVWTPLASPHCQVPSPQLLPILATPGHGEMGSPPCASWVGQPPVHSHLHCSPGWLVRHSTVLFANRERALRSVVYW